MLRIFTILTALIISGSAGFAQDHLLKLQSGTIQTTENTAAFAAASNPQDVVDGYYYRLLQFNAIPDKASQSRMKAEGLILMEYLPVNAYMTAIPVGYDRSKLAGHNIRSVIQLQHEQKINRNILGEFPSWCINSKGTADLTVQYMGNISHSRALILIGSFGSVLNSNADNHTIDLRIDDRTLYTLAANEWVYYVSAIAAPSFPEDNKGRSLHRSNSINTDNGFVTGRKYDGTGVVAGLADDGFVGPHIDFTGRIFNFATGTGQTHGDMTSGILAGSGNLNPIQKGMGSGAFLYVYNISNYPHVVDAVNNYNTLGTVITSTSYSQGCNEYTTDSEFGDELLNNNRQISFVFSAGNNQTANCGYGAGAGWGNITGGYKQGKNVISVANLDAMEVLDNTSSRGPASDGRIKPDISANGRDQMSTDENNTYQVGGGTSAACPGIAGLLTQLYQAYKIHNGGAEPQAALMKACLLNGAEDIGNPGPDYTYGWGRVNALRAVETIEENRYIHDSTFQGMAVDYQITVPAGMTELRVMVYWNDKAGTPLAATQLVSDLDITLTDTAGNVVLPWKLDESPTVAAITAPAVRGIDRLNNMEQVTIDNPYAGNYTLTVNGFSVPFGPQDYYVVYEFRNDELTLTYPIGGETFAPGQAEVIRWDGKKGLGNYTLEYSLDNGVNWNVISSSINQNSQQYNWSIPLATPVSHDALLRISRGSFSDVSDTTIRIVGVPTGLSITYVCPDSLRLAWNPVNGATGYTIYQLGAKYMEVIGTSSTNSYVVPNFNPMVENWFSVSSQINGFDGRRAVAIHQAPGLMNCPLSVDGGISAIMSPSGTLRDCFDNSALSVEITYTNYGVNPASNIPVSYSLDNGTPINEIIAGPIPPGGQITHTFATTGNLSATGSHTLQVWSAMAGDQNIYNDTLENIISVVASTVQTFPLSEDFESLGNCSTASDCGGTICSTGLKWINQANGTEDDIDFRVNSGSTPSSGTGPDVDHTFGTGAGNYIYLEPSGTCSNQTALLTAPCVDLTTVQGPLLRFWYHMFGVSMGSLSVEVFSDGAWNTTPFTRNGNQGNQWTMGTVDLSSYTGNTVDIRFRAVTGTGFESDLALDDIALTTGAGVNEHSAYANVQVYPNPSTGIFTLQTVNHKSEELMIDITDVQGRVIRSEKFQTASGMTHTLNLQKETKGVYFLNIKGEEGVRTIRITLL